ncbi:MAG: glutamate racemase [Candidatus Zixiibacteriota bacterium]|nr:MAG: glutamate racemase [candidate division Zixibacteria bacterium]
MIISKAHRTKAIGIFDSGIGGLTVVAEIIKQLPNENVIYFGDTGRYPYGPRSREIIRKFSKQNVNFLLEKGVKFIIIACNTASAFALEYVRKMYTVPMIGVVKPGSEAAARLTGNGRIGVIGTEGTIVSSSYQKELKKLNGSLKISAKPCPLFVSLAEEGYIDKPAARLIARDYLSEIKQKKIDTLVLGCTHYPLLKKVIGNVMGGKVTLVDSAEQTASAVKDTLTRLELDNPSKKTGEKRFYVSDSPEKFKRLGERFLGKRIGKVNLIDINAY